MAASSSSAIPAIHDDEFNLFDAPNMTGTPERRLILAVLERAILDYVGNDTKEVSEAEQWFSDKESTFEFSFGWVCQQLDLDAPRIANIVQQMPKRGTNRIAPWYFGRAISGKESR